MDYPVRIIVLVLWELLTIRSEARIFFGSSGVVAGQGLLTTGKVAHKQMGSVSTHIQRTIDNTAKTLTTEDTSVEKSLLRNASGSDEISKPSKVMSSSTTTMQTTNTQLKSVLETTAPSELAVPEFEDRNEQDEGGKGEEVRFLLQAIRLYTFICVTILYNYCTKYSKEPDANADEVRPDPPQENAEMGEGVAKEDTEPAKEKENMTQQVEDAKGNVPAPKKIQPKVGFSFEIHAFYLFNFKTLISLCFQIKPQIDFNQSEDSHFMTFLTVGLIIEGRAGARRNVRYRRLSQKDDPEAFREDVIY
uniref:Uncharacterized protein n=1 Tax=Heterorhabditis bacteriophora TaxID=37862 RepID=A0A1I7XAW3_HETBA